MKRVLSFVLAFVMISSVFSCVPVAAAESVLVVDQEYRISSGETVTFIPEESGTYKFESSGIGDPRITIDCNAGNFWFDDEKSGMNFSGTVDLEAGETVSCYLYNYHGEDCVFKITKVIRVESISFSPKEPIEFMEETNGYFEDFYNSSTGEWEKAYFYEGYSINQSGNALVVNYEDGSSSTFVYKNGGFYNDAGEYASGVRCYDYQSVTPWTVGGDNYIIVKYSGVETKVPVNIFENPVKSISFSLAEPIEIIEGTKGEWESDWNDENEYFHYYTPSLRKEGNSFTIDYKDGTSEVYTYNYDDVGFYNSDGEVIYLDVDENQSYSNQWTVNGDNYLTITYMGRETKVPVKIIESPYESMSFTFSDPLEFIENTSGEFEEITNPSTGEKEKVFIYNYQKASKGNTLVLNRKDGTKETYVCDGAFWRGTYYNADGDSIDALSFSGNQYEIPWTVGGDNYITVEYLGMETKVPVNIIENSVESMTFVPAKPIEITENREGQLKTEEVYNEKTGENEDVEYYRYDTDSLLSRGDAIILNYKDGTSKKYLYRWGEYYWSDKYLFVNEDNERITIAAESEQSAVTPWTKNGENFVTLSYDEHKTQVPVNIVESPYESISFNLAKPIEILENTNGSWHSMYYNYQRVYYFCYDSPALYKEGNSITVKYKDGRSIKYSYDEEQEAFLSPKGEEITFSRSMEEQSYENQYEVGSTKYLTIEYEGLTTKIPFKIVENDKVNNEGFFRTEKLSEDSCVITGILEEAIDDGELTIPEAIGGYKVTAIAPEALQPYDVRGELEKISLPSTIDSVSKYTFEECYNLEEIIVDEDNAVFASLNGVLYNKKFTEIVAVPSDFEGELVITKGITEISDEVIVAISKVSSITVEEGNTAFVIEDGILYNKDFTKIYRALSVKGDYVMKPSVKELVAYSFRGQEALTSAKISSKVTEISYGSFSNCSSLKNVELPEKLNTIGDGAFSHSGVEEISLPSATKEIEGYAFEFCSSLSTVSFNKGLEKIGASAFYDTGLESVTLPDSITKIDYMAFKGSALQSVTLPDSSFEMKVEVFSGCDKLKSVDLGSGLKTIPSDTFSGCKALEAITIPENVTVLDYGCFSHTGLKNVKLHNKITDISGAFLGCRYLESVYIGKNVQYMYDAFSGCRRLKNIEFADGADRVSAYTFDGCKSLTEIELPASVSEVCYNAFRGCTSLDKVDIPDELYKMSSQAFDNTKWYNKQALGDVYLEHILYTYKGSMEKDYTLSIKEGTKAIAEYAYCDIKSLAKVEVPNGFKYIGKAAFKGCKNLSEINIPDSVEYIGEVAFAGCKTLTEITVPASVKHIGDYALGYSYGWNGSEFDYIKRDDFKIIGVKCSAAETYAKENGITFIPIAGEHDIHASDWIIDKEPTYTKKGTKHKECTKCGEVLETKSIPQLKCGKPTIKAENYKKDVKVSWSKVSGADYYYVYRKVKGGSYKYIGKTTKTYLMDDEASSGKTYYYKARVKNEAGYSDYSSVKSLKHLDQPSLKSPKNTSTGVKVIWSKVAGAAGYKVYRKTSKGWKYIGKTKKTYFTDDTAKSGKKYTYTVKAYSGDYSSTYNSKGVSKYYLADPALKTPTSTRKGIVLKWSKITGADGYMVYRKTGSGSYSRIATVKGYKKVTYTDKKARKGKKYTYKVKAYKSKTYSAYSKTRTIKDKY